MLILVSITKEDVGLKQNKTKNKSTVTFIINITGKSIDLL